MERSRREAEAIWFAAAHRRSFGWSLDHPHTAGIRSLATELIQESVPQAAEGAAA